MNTQKYTIDDIMSRLERGETLMIDDQLRSYIHMEISDGPTRFVMRSVLAWQEDGMKRVDLPPQYEEQRFDSLASALLSLTDWQWREAGGNADALPAISQESKET